MSNRRITSFLKEQVGEEYAFFWQVYDGAVRTRRRARVRFATNASRQKLDDIDSKPPFLECMTSGRRRYYAPLRTNPVLHRTFSEIRDDRGIVQFAASYGLLGFSRFHEIRRKDGATGGLLVSESIARWRYELAEMQRLVHLWELVKNNRTSLLAALMSNEKDGLHIILGRRRECIAAADSLIARKWEARGEAPVEAAHYFLTNCINRKTGENVRPLALPSYNKHVYLSPGNLCSALWLMFLWEVIGETHPRQCPACGDWFDPRRSTRKTCGDRCRKRFSRQKTSTS